MEKVLCLDDGLSILLPYRDELPKKGYKVVLAEEGQEGLPIKKICSKRRVPRCQNIELGLRPIQ